MDQLWHKRSARHHEHMLLPEINTAKRSTNTSPCHFNVTQKNGLWVLSECVHTDINIAITLACTVSICSDSKVAEGGVVMELVASHTNSNHVQAFSW